MTHPRRPRRSLPGRVAGAILRRTGRTLVVPRNTIGSQEYARAFGGRWHTAYPAAGRVSRRPPVRYGSRIADFDSPVDPVPELGVLELARGSVVGLEGWIVSREGQLLPEHSWYGIHSAEMDRRLPRDRTPQRVVRLMGSAVSLVTRSGDSNYGHFLLDSIGRLALLEMAGLRLADVDHVIGAVPHPAARQMLQRAGVSANRLILAADGMAVQPDVLFAPTFPGTRRNCLPWLVEFLRRTAPMAGRAHAGGRRLYVQRKATRRILNEAELLPLLEERQFEIYDPSQHDDPPTDFAGASVVVGAHGAGLADLAFCRPGTSVLELIPEDHTMPYWYTLAEAGGLRYGYLICDAYPSPLGASKSDITVSVDDFRAALADVLNAARLS